MGVRGFWQFFSILNDWELLKTRVKRGSRLLIDGYGFMYYTMKQLLATEPPILVYLLLLVLLYDANDDLEGVKKAMRNVRSKTINDGITKNIAVMHTLLDYDDDSDCIKNVIRRLGRIKDKLNESRYTGGFDDIDDDMIRRLIISLQYKVTRDLLINRIILIYETGQQNNQIDRRYCGSYSEYRLLIIEELKVINNYGFKVSVYFDGKRDIGFKNSMKKQESNDKDYKEISSWDYFYNAIDNNQFIRDHSDIPLPVMTAQCLISVLRELSINDIRFCNGEADIDMAKDCRNYNSKGEECYVYSDDSDMVMMKNIKVTKFGRFSQGQSGTTNDNDVYEFIVWTRESIADYIGLNEYEFVEFCILLGTDRTKSFSRHDYDDIDNTNDISDKLSIDIIKKCFNFIKNMNEKNEGYQLKSSRNPILQLGIEYSRVFYDDDVNQDDKLQETIKRYYEICNEADMEFEDADKDQIEIEDDIKDIDTNIDDETTTTKIVSDSKSDDVNRRPYLNWDLDMISNIREYVKDKVTDFNTIFNEEKDRKVAAGLLSQQVLSYINGYYKDKDDEEILKYGISRDHLNKYEKMLQKLHTDKPNKLLSRCSPPVVWKDVIAATLLQQIFDKFVIEYLKHTESDYNNRTRQRFFCLSGMLSYLFDGRVFFDEMNPNKADDDDTKNNIKEEIGHFPRDAKNIKLPVYDNVKAIIELIKTNRVSIITGDTGSGKSTGVPQILMMNDRNNKILITEPNRESVKSLYKQVKSNIEKEKSISDCSVAMRIGGGDTDSKCGDDNSDITFATAGYIFAKFRGDLSEAKKYTHIILDECHVRSIENDLVLLIIKQLLLMYKDLKVILMSATFDTEGFKTFFDISSSDNYELNVGTSPHSKLTYYIDDISLDCSKNSTTFGSKSLALHQVTSNMKGSIGEKVFIEALDMIKEFCSKYDKSNGKMYLSNNFLRKQIDIVEVIVASCLKNINVGDGNETSKIRGILIFVSGESEIESIENRLRFLKGTIVFEKIHRELEKESYDQTIAYQSKDNVLRVIVATNAAESSITIEDVDLVIDLGCCKREEYDVSNVSKSILVKKFISKPSAHQRAGRTGRVRKGFVIRLYTKEIYHNDQIFSIKNFSDIMNTPLHEVIIKTLGSFGLFTYSSIDKLFEDLIEKPITDNVKLINSLKYLKDNNLITADGDSLLTTCTLTRLGHFASKIPIASSLSRMIYYGIMLGVGEYSLVIATILTISDRPFRKPSTDYNAPDEYNDIIRNITTTCYEYGGHHSEPICFLNIYIAMIKRIYSLDFFNFREQHALDSRKFQNFHKTLDTIQRNTNEALRSCHFNDTRLMTFSKLKHGPDRISKCNEEILKYLLLWCSDFSLIKCDNRSLPTKTILSNTRAFKYPRLTSAKIDQLFPAPANSMRTKTDRRRIEVDVNSNNVYDTNYFIKFISKDRKCITLLNAFWIFDYRNDQFVFGINMNYSQCEASFKLLKEKFTIEGREVTDGDVVIIDEEVVTGWKFIRFNRPTLHDRSVTMEYSILFNCTVEIFILKKSSKICLRTSNFMLPSNVFSEQTRCLELGSYEKITFENDLSNSMEASLNDVPFGMKLLNSYTCKQDYHTLAVGTLDAITNHENFVMPISTLAKGYAPVKWKLVTLESLLPSADVEQATSSVANITVEPETVENLPIINVVSIDKDSLCYHAVPYRSPESDDVYAVVSTLTHSQKENKHFAQCEYVTILEYGEQFLLSALACVSDVRPKCVVDKGPLVVDEGPLDDWEIDDVAKAVDQSSDLDWEMDEPKAVDQSSTLANEIKTIIETKSLSPDEVYLKSDDLKKNLKKSLLKLHYNLTSKTVPVDDEVTDHYITDCYRNLNAIPPGQPYIRSYIVSNLSLGSDRNKKMSENILRKEFRKYGQVVSLMFYNMLEIAIVEIRHSTDSDGNPIHVLDCHSIYGSPIDLYGLYVNDKGIIVYNLIPDTDVDISDEQKSLKLEQLPDLPSEMLKEELKELFSNFGHIYKVTMIHNDQGSFIGKAYVNFDNRSKIEMRMALSMNDKWVGQYKLMKVSIA